MKGFLLLCVVGVQCFVPPVPVVRRDGIVMHESLAEGLFKQAFGGLMKKPAAAAAPSITSGGKPVDPGKLEEVASIDSRAQSGKVTFDDFLQVGRTFRAFNGKVPGMPGSLTAQQIEETMAKFDKHEKIVEAMLEEERASPQLLIDDLNNTKEKCPRVQRLSRVSGVDERSVALFVAEFEAMRQSTQRIASGEDPDKVNADIGSSNRAQRRAMKKAEKKKKKKN